MLNHQQHKTAMETNNLQIPSPAMEMAGKVMDSALGIETAAEPEQNPSFIESNTQTITLDELENNCIVPTFSDNTLTIPHQNFIKTVRSAAESVFGELTPVEARVSHPINGRTPEAILKRKEDLIPEDTTLFYQRMAWLCKVQSLTRIVNGQTVHLVIGGVRAYNEDKLYSRRSPEKFKIFVGWQVRVCSNLMLTCDGNSGSIECLTEADIYQKALLLFQEFNLKKDAELRMLENLHNTRLSEQQFVNIIGRLRLYEALDSSQKKSLPTVTFGDQAANSAVRGFIDNPNFGLGDEDSISCWQLMQLFNEAVKSSYIDKWLERNQNATDFALGIQLAVTGDPAGESYRWFLQ